MSKKKNQAKITGAHVVCQDCGEKYGNKPEGTPGAGSTISNCDICGFPKRVYQFGSFGYARKLAKGELLPFKYERKY